jgi:hypothetical protein
MKISEIIIEAEDTTRVIEELKKTEAFKKISERFELISTERQIKNGTLVLVTKPHVLKIPRTYTFAKSGNLSAAARGQTLATKIKFSSQENAGTLNFYVDALEIIDSNFTTWHEKNRRASQKVSNDLIHSGRLNLNNLGLKSLTEFNLSKLKQEITQFSANNNYLTDLKGFDQLRLSLAANIYFIDNDLTSVEGAPKTCGTFNVENNKLTSFKGFPEEAEIIDIELNPFTSFSDVTKYVKKCKTFRLPIIKAGLLSFLKIPGCERIGSFSPSATSDF